MSIRLKCERCRFEKIVPCPNETFGGYNVSEFCERCGAPLLRVDECSDMQKPMRPPRGGPGGILE